MADVLKLTDKLEAELLTMLTPGHCHGINQTRERSKGGKQAAGCSVCRKADAARASRGAGLVPAALLIEQYVKSKLIDLSSSARFGHRRTG